MSNELRSRAEEKAAANDFSNELTPEEMQRTLYELRVHQIELEMQNEEMRLFQEELDAARERYFDLFELAPLGYCTTDGKGFILQSNLTLSGMLGVNKAALLKQPLSRYIFMENIENRFYFILKQLFASRKPGGRAAHGESGRHNILGAVRS